jgi:hypothetical protein
VHVIQITWNGVERTVRIVINAAGEIVTYHVFTP